MPAKPPAASAARTRASGKKVRVATARQSPAPADSDRSADSVDRALRALHVRVRPTNYYSGSTAAMTMLPRSLLVFNRLRLHEELKSVPDMHYRFLLLCCVKGEGDVVLDGISQHLRPYSCLLFFPYQSHYYSRLSTGDNLWFFTTFEYPAAGELSALRNRAFGLAENDLLQVNQWRQALANKDPTEAACQVAHFLAALLKQATRNTEPRKAARTPQTTGQAGTDWIRSVTALIHAQMPRLQGLKELAAAVGSSESRLRAAFRASTGMSLGRYLRRARVYRACQMLSAQNQNVSEVAQACGFSSLYAFSRCFRQIMGEPPSAFLHRHRQGIAPENKTKE